MSAFPTRSNLTIVSDLYRHYELGFDDRERVVYVHCEHCSDIVCIFDYDTIYERDELSLYELIIDMHRPL